MKVGSVGRRGGEMFTRKMNLWKHLAKIFYKLSAFPVYHLLRDSKHMQRPNLYISAIDLEPSLDCILKNHAGRLHKLVQSPTFIG